VSSAAGSVPDRKGGVSPSRRANAAAAALDLGAVALFVVIGRASHHHGESPAGIASTAWPFVAGLVAGWLVVARRSPATMPAGAVVCAATVAVGMVLRVVAGQGTAAAFVAVATGFLGAVMLGGRFLLRRVRR
jgi:peptidoglycan/LPS O-acetylase OafA/YrhL